MSASSGLPLSGKNRSACAKDGDPAAFLPPGPTDERASAFAADTRRYLGGRSSTIRAQINLS